MVRLVGSVVRALIFVTACDFPEEHHADAPRPDGPYEDEPATGLPEAPEESFVGPCVPHDWLAEDEDAPGVPTSFDLVGSRIEVDAERMHVDSIPAPLTFDIHDGGVPLLAFADARVDDEHEGTLVAVGAVVKADRGALLDVERASSWIDGEWVVVEIEGDHEGPYPDLGSMADPAHAAALADAIAIPARAEALRIVDFDEAYVITEAAMIRLTQPFTVTAARTYWSASSRIGAAVVGNALDGEMTIGLDPDSGHLRADGERVPGLPVVLLGRDAVVQVGPRNVRTVEDIPVRQALSVEGALVPAAVELRLCEPPVLRLYPGERRVLRMAYRERTGLADAVLGHGHVEVHSQGGAEWSVLMPIDRTVPDAIGAAALRHPHARWAELVPRGPHDPGLLDALACLFSFGLACPSSEDDHFVPLAPYPGWLEAGEVGEVDMEITAPRSRGQHLGTITIVGDNYEAIVPFEVEVY